MENERPFGMAGIAGQLNVKQLTLSEFESGPLPPRGKTVVIDVAPLCPTCQGQGKIVKGRPTGRIDELANEPELRWRIETCPECGGTGQGPS